MHDFLINETFNQLILVVGSSFWLLTSSAHDFRCHLALAHLAETLRIKLYIKQLPQEGHSDWLIARNAQAFCWNLALSHLA
jgi:hypothetical protein